MPETQAAEKRSDRRCPVSCHMVVLKAVGKGKKNKRKEKKERKSGMPAQGFEGPGDLRAVRHHVEQWRKHGVEEARNMLMMLGRDASFTVCEVAEEWKDEELLAFGRRLVAVRPQLETNLDELRRLSVKAHVERAKESAVPAVEIEGVEAIGGAFALFDPQRLIEDLTKGGRPRKELDRVNAGDVAWFGLPTAAATAVRFTSQPAPAGALRLRLRVDSGVVFAGAPEASDGPRLGTVRLDPQRTRLDEHLNSGHFLRMKPGVYRIDARLESGTVMVHLRPDEAPETKLEIDLQRMSLSDPVDGDGAQG
jgi:hypothetical protein